MKRIVATAMFFLFITTFITKAFAVICDGKDSGYEWDSASAIIVTDGETNCNVSQGMIKSIVSNKDNAVYFALFLYDKNLESDNTAAGFTLYIDENNSVTITANSFTESYNNNKYTFAGAMSVNESNGAFAEIRVGFKEGIPETIGGSVRFIDNSGEPSNYYNFEIINVDYVEPTALTIAPTINKPDEDTTKTSAAKTTKEKKSTTKKRTTTKKATTREQETTEKIKTTKKKTTTKKSTTKKRTTTKKATTKKKTTVKAKTTERKTKPETKSTSKRSNKTTVIYIEKDTVFTQLQITSTSTNTTETVEIIPTEESELNSDSFFIRQSEELKKGEKYKQIIIVVTSIIFAGMFGWTLSGLKYRKPENQEDDSNDNNTNDNK